MSAQRNHHDELKKNDTQKMTRTTAKSYSRHGETNLSDKLMRVVFTRPILHLLLSRPQCNGSFKSMNSNYRLVRGFGKGQSRVDAVQSICYPAGCRDYVRCWPSIDYILEAIMNECFQSSMIYIAVSRDVGE